MAEQEVTLAYGGEGADMEPTGLYDDHVLKAGTRFRLKYYTQYNDLNAFKTVAQQQLIDQNVDATVLSTEQTSQYAVAHCVMNSDAVISGIGQGLITAVIWAIIIAVGWILAVLILPPCLRLLTALIQPAGSTGIPWLVWIAIGGIALFIVAKGFGSKQSNPRGILKKRRK